MKNQRKDSYRDKALAIIVDEAVAKASATVATAAILAHRETVTGCETAITGISAKDSSEKPQIIVSQNGRRHTGREAMGAATAERRGAHPIPTQLSSMGGAIARVVVDTGILVSRIVSLKNILFWLALPFGVVVGNGFLKQTHFFVDPTYTHHVYSFSPSLKRGDVI